MPVTNISIITPVYNTGSFLMEAVESFLNQKAYQHSELPICELIIVDDHSNDQETLNILEILPSLSTNIKVFKNQRKKGVAGARNTGIDLAQGEWIGFLDSDDLFLPHSLSYRWNYINQNSHIAWLATPYLLLKEEIGIEKKPFSERNPFLYSIIHENYDKNIDSVISKPIALLCKYCILHVNTVLIKKEILIGLGGFNENLKCAEDYELWFKLAAQHDLHYLIEDTSVYRIRPGSLTHSSVPMYYYEDAMIYSLINNNNFKPYIPILQERLHFVLVNYCYFYRQHGSLSDQIKWSLKLIQNFPLSLKSWQLLIAALLRLK